MPGVLKQAKINSSHMHIAHSVALFSAWLRSRSQSQNRPRGQPWHKKAKAVFATDTAMRLGTSSSLILF